MIHVDVTTHPSPSWFGLVWFGLVGFGWVWLDCVAAVS